MIKDNKGVRHNQDKLRWDLLPILPLNEVLKVLGDGAKEYDEWNWYRGQKYSVSYASGQRHRSQWWLGEDYDKDSGNHHLAHSIVNDLFNLTFQLEKRSDLDDRIKVENGK